MDNAIKTETIHIIRTLANDQEFMKQLFATIYANSENTFIKQLALEAFMELDECELPNITELEKK